MTAAERLAVADSAADPLPEMPLIEVNGISKKFARSLRRSLFYAVQDLGMEIAGRPVRPVLRSDEFWALQNISFSLRRGESLGIIGPNGAGKSTLLKIITGIIKPTTGFVRTRGRVQALIELSSGMSPVLTGRENIYIRSQLFGIPKAVVDERFEDIVRFAELEDYIDMPVQNYSSGMRVKLGFAIAINVDPDVLILDEVLAVGDQRFRAKAREAMQELLERNITLIYISHNMNQVMSITDQALWIDRGKVQDIGEAREVCARYTASQREGRPASAAIVEMSRSIGALSLIGFKKDRPIDSVTKRVRICGRHEERGLTVQLELLVNEAVSERIYFTWFLVRNGTDFSMYKMVQDVCTESVGEALKRSFSFDLSSLNPGSYQMGLLIQPEDGATAVLYGTYELFEIEVAPPVVGQLGWQPGAPHFERMVSNSLGSCVLPVALID